MPWHLLPALKTCFSSRTLRVLLLLACWRQSNIISGLPIVSPYLANTERSQSHYYKTLTCTKHPFWEKIVISFLPPTPPSTPKEKTKFGNCLWGVHSIYILSLALVHTPGARARRSVPLYRNPQTTVKRWGKPPWEGFLIRPTTIPSLPATAD